MAKNDEPSEISRPAGEGIRIIGAEEAAAALEAGQAEGRRPVNAPRYGDRPAPPPDGPRPTLRFPSAGTASRSEQGSAIRPAPVEPAEPGVDLRDGERAVAERAPNEIVGETPHKGTLDVGPANELPHWTAPPTGEVPNMLPGSTPTDEPGEWAGFNRSPRWRDQGGDWEQEGFADASVLADGVRMGALDSSRTEHSDLYSFDDVDGPADPPPPPQRIRTSRNESEEAPVGFGGSGGRDNGAAAVIGVVLGVVFLGLAHFGPKPLVFFATVIVVLIAAEFFSVLRRAGYRPATLLGLVATVSLMFGSYWRGERAYGLILVLALAFSLLWYLAGVMHARPTINVAITLLGFVWAGVLGSYATLLLRPANYPTHPRNGVTLLVGAVLCTVANDLGAYVFGRSFGRTPLAAAISPQKTWEGFLGGALCTILVGIGLVSRIHPWTISAGLWLGVIVAIVAPLGDLCESLVKRDIGVKDMGTILPGHGGVFDRFDALLFVLPATYYLVQVLHLARR